MCTGGPTDAPTTLGPPTPTAREWPKGRARPQEAAQPERVEAQQTFYLPVAICLVRGHLGVASDTVDVHARDERNYARQQIVR